ncbi:MAG: acyl-CoA thioesterase [Oscillospiraceae bacterium]|nr:acyl-CoA thioesterase [Oscillospiraceae bacterium]
MQEIKPYKRTAMYYETDRMGVVHHSNYIRWFEEARVYYLSEAGFPYVKMEEMGVMLPVLSAECSYKNHVVFDETVYITPKIEKYNGFRLEISYTVTGENGTVKAEGRTSHCFVDTDMKPVRINKEYPDIHKVFSELG